MKVWSVLLAAATMLGCSSRAGLVPDGPTGAAGNPQGIAGLGGAAGGGGLAGASGAAGAGPASGLCPSRTGRRPDQLALLGQDAGDIVFVQEDGTIQRVRGPGSRNLLFPSNGWVAAYDAGSTTTWKAQLLDVTGRVRAEASGQNPPGAAGRSTAFGYVTVFPDGTATFDRGNTSDDLVLTPDGRARVRPAFTTEPDAAGWVGADLFSPTATPRIPVMLNVETGEIRKLSLLAANDAWAPIVSGARRLYLAEIGGRAVLVDESPAGARQISLPGFARRDLEAEVVVLPDGRPVAYVSLYDSARNGLPIWLYDLSTGALDSALPDGVLPAQATSARYPDGRIELTAKVAPSGVTRLWTVELSTGALLDYRAGLAVRRIRPAPGGPSQWTLLADGAKRIYRYDRATGALEDLHLTGDSRTSGRRALVVRDDRPLAVVSIDDGKVVAIPGGDSLPPGIVDAAGRWAVGFATPPDRPWALGLPVWRVDLETAETRAFSTPDASLMPLLGGGRAPLFSGIGTPVIADGRVGVMLYDGLGVSLFLAEPGEAWRAIGRRVRQVTWVGWAAGPAFAVAAEKDCNCYGPLTLSWPTTPADAPELLSGTSLQLIAPDGTDAFPPTAGEHLRAFADESASCALATTDAHEWFVYDTQARTRLSLGRFEALSWVTDAR